MVWMIFMTIGNELIYHDLKIKFYFLKSYFNYLCCQIYCYFRKLFLFFSPLIYFVPNLIMIIIVFICITKMVSIIQYLILTQNLKNSNFLLNQIKHHYWTSLQHILNKIIHSNFSKKYRYKPYCLVILNPLIL